MVILGKKYGRLANRLWIFSYFAANAIEYNYKLLYRNFDEYIRYFPACRKNDFGAYPIRVRLSRWLIADYLLYWSTQLVIEILNKLDLHFGKVTIIRTKAVPGEKIFDLSDKNYLKKAHANLAIIRNGGLFYRDNASLQKHAGTLRQFFRPLKKYETNIAAWLEKNKLPDRKLVGVHLRKYDFRKFLGGRFFCTDQDYLNNMKLIQKKLAEEGFQTQFLLCSDEKIDADFFSEIDFFTGTGHFIEDLYSFARCDYLIGPPSSFTSWASFYGNVPACFIPPESKLIDPAHFKVVDDIQIIYDFY